MRNRSRFALAFLLASASLPTAADKIVVVVGGESAVQGVPETKLNAPFGIDFDSSGKMYFVEMTGNRLRRYDGKKDVTILGGNGEKGFAGDGGPVGKAQFNGPHSLVVAGNGDIYMADTWNNRVRRIDARKQVITTAAGTGKKGFSGDGGPVTEADFGGIYSVALDDSSENLYLADLDNRRIRKVHLKSGLVQTVAGNGQKGVPSDGATATNAPLVDPRAVAVGTSGVIYILERSGHALRAVDGEGRIATLAGTGQKGFSGDGGDAREATLNGPKDLCIDREGNVIIADTENHVIRKYIPRLKTLERVAGTGTKGAKGLDGPPLDAELSQPHGVTIDANGALYIADSSNHRILKIVK